LVRVDKLNPQDYYIKRLNNRLIVADILKSEEKNILPAGKIKYFNFLF
jgi:hypothetical protein